MEYKGNLVKISESAHKQILKLKEKETSEKCLRIGAKNGGCSGFSYIFEFDEPKENDIKEVFEGYQVVIDPTQAALILHLQVDYESGLNNRGFIFTNPNAKSTCGCGTSFS